MTIPAPTTAAEAPRRAHKASTADRDAPPPKDAIERPALDSENDFEWSYTDEPHATRRQLILAAHPEVKNLFGPCPWTKWKVLFAVSSQVFACWALQGAPWWLFLVVAYAWGGTVNHSMTLAMHEISHNLAFRTPWVNKLFGMVANMPLGLPASASFLRYHMEHHKYQGEDGIDTDVPTRWEASFFTTAPRKVLWMLLQPAFYALRPMIVAPKVPRAHEMINIAMQLSFNAAIWYFFGGRAVFYLIIGTLLGMGLHPLAGHFIAEHYTFVQGVETYSYYGPLNWVSFNVGYHNEHHDFPYVPGSRLPELRRIAHEFYDDMPHHSSWVKVIWNYIMDPTMGPHRRVKRRRASVEELRRINPVAATKIDGVHAKSQ